MQWRIGTRGGAGLRRRWMVRVWLPGLMLLASGCAHLGGATVEMDRIAYSNALASSWKKEALLNIVRIRYLDPPVFLNISSLVNGYTRRGEAGASLNPYDVSASLGLNGSVSLEERPTITYSAPSSASFSAMLTPIEPIIPLTLIESGWDAALVLRLTVRSINGVRNERATEGTGDYDRILTLVRRIQKADALHMELRPGEKKGEFSQVLFLPVRNPRPEVAAAIAELRQLLHLEPGLQEYRVVRNSIDRADHRTLVLQTRSVMHMLTEFASCIEVPEEDRDRGVVFPAGAPEDCDLIRVHSGPMAPERAFVRVRYDGHRFWIDREDYQSKLHFAYLLMILRAAARDEESGAPLLTIPTS